jgi:hypothetical protein
VNIDVDVDVAAPVIVAALVNRNDAVAVLSLLERIVAMLTKLIEP